MRAEATAVDAGGGLWKQGEHGPETQTSSSYYTTGLGIPSARHQRTNTPKPQPAHRPGLTIAARGFSITVIPAGSGNQVIIADNSTTMAISSWRLTMRRLENPGKIACGYYNEQHIPQQAQQA